MNSLKNEEYVTKRKKSKRKTFENKIALKTRIKPISRNKCHYLSLSPEQRAPKTARRPIHYRRQQKFVGLNTFLTGRYGERR